MDKSNLFVLSVRDFYLKREALNEDGSIMLGMRPILAMPPNSRRG